MDTKDPRLLEIPGAGGQAVDFLTKLLGQATPKFNVAGGYEMPEAHKLGMGELERTLGGEFYDPRKSDFWKGYRDYTVGEEAKGISDIRRRGQLGGGLYSKGSMIQESEYKQGSKAQRGMMLGGLFEKERERKLGATGTALQYAGEEYRQQMGKAGAEFTADLVPYTHQADIAKTLMPQWFVDQGEDPLSGILGLAGKLGSAYIGK